MRWHSVIWGRLAARPATLGSCPAVGLTRTNAVTGETECGRADLHPVARDDPAPFQALYALGHRWCAHADPPGKGRHGDLRVGLQFGEQAAVDLVE